MDKNLFKRLDVGIHTRTQEDYLNYGKMINYGFKQEIESQEEHNKNYNEMRNYILNK